MKEWLSWSDVPKMLVSSLPGWISLWWIFRNERTILRFRFEASVIESKDEYGADYSIPAIRFIVTNTGKRPVSLDGFICEATFRGARNSSFHPYRAIFAAVTLGHGEPHSAWIELSANPSKFGAAYARDSTVKTWLAGKRELKTTSRSSQKAMAHHR